MIRGLLGGLVITARPPLGIRLRWDWGCSRTERQDANVLMPEPFMEAKTGARVGGEGEGHTLIKKHNPVPSLFGNLSAGWD